MDHKMDLEANATVYRYVEDGATRDAIITAMCFTDEPNPEDSSSYITYVYLEGQLLINAERTRGRAPAKKSKDDTSVIIDASSTVLAVRWATPEEMDALSANYYEKAGKGSWMVPVLYAKDPFAYFNELAEPTSTADSGLLALFDTEDPQEARFKAVAQQYSVYTTELVVEKQFPSFRDGRAVKKVQLAGKELQAALCVAGEHIASDNMMIASPSEKLSELTDIDLPYDLAQKLGRLRGSPNDYDEDSPSTKKKTTGAKPPKTPSGAGSAGKKGGSSTKGSSSKKGADSVGGSLGAQTVAQARQLAKVKDDLASEQGKVRTLESRLRVQEDELKEVNMKWTSAWKEQTKSLRFAMSLLRQGDCTEETLVELAPINPPYKLGESRPVPKSPSPARFPASPPAKKQRKR
jgi:hypothetical protein